MDLTKRLSGKARGEGGALKLLLRCVAWAPEGIQEEEQIWGEIVTGFTVEAFRERKCWVCGCIYGSGKVEVSKIEILRFCVAQELSPGNLL